MAIGVAVALGAVILKPGNLPVPAWSVYICGSATRSAKAPDCKPAKILLCSIPTCMSDGWSNEELKASVECYVEMQRKERAGQLIAKKQYYRKLAQRFGRSEKAFENRMQNISYILSLMGRSWLTGLKPAKNVDADVADQIEKLFTQLDGQKAVAVAAFEITVRENCKGASPRSRTFIRSRRTKGQTPSNHAVSAGYRSQGLGFTASGGNLRMLRATRSV